MPIFELWAKILMTQWTMHLTAFIHNPFWNSAVILVTELKFTFYFNTWRAAKFIYVWTGEQLIVSISRVRFACHQCFTKRLAMNKKKTLNSVGSRCVSLKTTRLENIHFIKWDRRASLSSLLCQLHLNNV